MKVELVDTHVNRQQNRKQLNATKKGAMNYTIHKLTYSGVIYHVICVCITATYHTSLNMCAICNIRQKVLLWGNNNTNILY